LQMTMETEDTTERLSAPTVPSWNFSPATPISTAAPGKQAEDENQELPGPTNRTTAPTSTCKAQRSHFDRAGAARTPRKHQRAGLPRSDLPLCSQETEFGQAKLDLGDELVNLRAELAMARGSEKQAAARIGRALAPRLLELSCLRFSASSPPSPSALARPPETGTAEFYTKDIVVWALRVGGG
jgi:hypothetical protein